MDDRGLQATRRGIVEQAVADDDYQVSLVDQASSGAVDADDPAAARALNDIGLDPGAVGDVDDRHLFALDQVGRFHQRGVERDRANVIQVGLSHRRSVDLRLHHGSHHCGRLP